MRGLPINTVKAKSNRPTIRPTDIAGYTVACTRLRTRWKLCRCKSEEMRVRSNLIVCSRDYVYANLSGICVRL